jgi:putative transposase
LIIQKAYKVELDPNKNQRILLSKSTGCARFAYNWGLNQRIKLYEEKKESTNAIKQHKLLNSIKKEEFPWMYEVTKCAPQEALRNLDQAFKNFFRRVKKKQTPGFPKFKSKHKDQDSFKITTGSRYITKKSVKLPNINGSIKLKEFDYIPTENVKYNSFTVSRKANRWFLSVQCEINTINVNNSSDKVLGIDIGIKNLVTLSNGKQYNSPDCLRFICF